MELTKTLTRKPSFADVIEQWLRAVKVPYICVDEAKKALFAGQKLKVFHFVAYHNSGRNSLIHCGERTKENLDDLRRWAEIFGDGFRALFAVKRKGGGEFRDLEGEPVDRAALLPAGQVAALDTGMITEEDRAARARESKAKFPNGTTAWGAARADCPSAAPSPCVPPRGVQGSLLGERYEGSAIGSQSQSMFGDMRPDPPAPRAELDTLTPCLFA